MKVFISGLIAGALIAVVAFTTSPLLAVRNAQCAIYKGEMPGQVLYCPDFQATTTGACSWTDIGSLAEMSHNPGAHAIKKESQP